MSLLSPYRSAILSNPDLEPASPALLIERSGSLSCHYAPFDHINRSAKVVLLGMTPGTQQAKNGLAELRKALVADLPEEDALRKAKEVASFSGPIRQNLVAMLDHVGTAQRLGVSSCAQLFTTRTDLVHFTSALRYPVFVNGKDYSGSPSIRSTPFLATLSNRWLAEEAATLRDAYWVPLGKEAKWALDVQVEREILSADRVLDGMVHPSPSNAERIAYFLGRKPREALSNRTDPLTIDSGKARLFARLGGETSSTPSKPDATCALSALETTSRISATAQPTTGSHQSNGGSGKSPVSQAEALIASKLPRIRQRSAKIAGFETPSGRHLALQRDVQGIQIWTEAVTAPPGIVTPAQQYSANRPRHSNLASQASRVATGREAQLWKPATIGELEDLLAWYINA